MSYKIKKIKDELRMLPEYLRYIFNLKKRAIYIGCLGQNNIGDDAVHTALKLMFRKNLRFYTIDYTKPSAGSVLRNFLFPKPNYIIVGGGTIIKKKANESYLKLILDYHEKFNTAKIMVLGSGVADPFLAKTIGFPTDVNAWVALLNKAHYIGVRGPLSYKILKENWQIDSEVNVFYDPTIYFEQALKKKIKEKTIGVNFCNIAGRIYGMDQEAIALFSNKLLLKLLDEGWQVILYPTTDKDISYMRSILTNDILNSITVFEYTPNIQEALRFFEKIDLFLGMRLHAIIFSALKSTPFYAIEYEQKTSDFLNSIEVSEFVCRTDSLDVNIIFEEIVNIYKNIDTIQNDLFHKIKQAKINQIEQIGNVLKMTYDS